MNAFCVSDFMTDWSVILSFIKWHLNIAALAVQRYIYVCHAPVAKQVMIYLKYIYNSSTICTDWWPLCLLLAVVHGVAVVAVRLLDPRDGDGRHVAPRAR